MSIDMKTERELRDQHGNTVGAVLPGKVVSDNE